MTRIELSFVVIGYRRDGERQLSVVVPITATVLDLMKQIKADQPDVMTCLSATLQLFLAKKGYPPAWLSSEDEDIDKLLDGDPVVVAAYTGKSKRMRRVRGVVAYFSGTLDSAQESKVHFIVRLPSIAASASEYDVKDLRYPHILKLRDELGLRFQSGRIDYFGYAEEPEDSSLPGFEWIRSIGEVDQRQKYMTYLQDNMLSELPNREQLFLEDARDDDTLMTVKDDKLPFALHGKVDLVLVDSVAKLHKDKLVGLQMVIMVQEHIQLEHRAEIIGQLVSVGLKVPDYVAPMALLTDLNNQWHFFWFEKPTSLNHLYYMWPQNAMKFVKSVVPLFADCAFHVDGFHDWVRVASLAQILGPDPAIVPSP